MSDDKFRIIVIDDDEDMRFILQGFLDNDFEVVTAENGLDALQKLPHYQPDLLLVDVMMPVMDGMQFAEEVKAKPGFNSLPFIFLTAMDSREDMMKGYESGADVYLTKPLVPERLIKNIKICLEKRSPLVKRHTLDEINKGVDLNPPKPPQPKPVEPKKINTKPKPKISPLTQATQKRSGGDSPLRIFTRPPRIIVISEDSELAPTFKHVFRNMCEVFGVKTVLKAIAIIPEWEPDIFIIELSGQNTLQAVSLIRKSRGLANAPLIIISAKNSAREKQQAQTFGADSYHGNDFYPVDVALALEAIVKKRNIEVRKKKIEFSRIEHEIDWAKDEDKRMADSKTAQATEQRIASFLKEQ